ncbi:hypothetical protein AMTRI_Chr05g69280 [Amborella trichopoda]
MFQLPMPLNLYNYCTIKGNKQAPNQDKREKLKRRHLIVERKREDCKERSATMGGCISRKAHPIRVSSPKKEALKGRKESTRNQTMKTALPKNVPIEGGRESPWRNKTHEEASKLVRNLGHRLSFSSREKMEEVLWKKPILLGERCRVLRSLDDGEAILYDEKGNQIVEMRPRFVESPTPSLS